MNILHLTTHLNKGGIASYIFSLISELKEKGHNITVASSGGDFVDIIKRNGIGHIDIPIRTKSEISPKEFISFFILERYLSEQKVDVIHSHTRVTQVLGAMLSKKLKIPFVTTCHGFFRPSLHRKKIPCWGDRVIAISRSVKDHLLKDFNVREDSIRLIYGGIDVENFKRYSEADIAGIRKEFNIPDNVFIVATVSRFSEVKGLDYFLKAAQVIIKGGDNFIFLLIGSGKEEESLKELSRSLGIEQKVRFISCPGDTPIFFSLMDVFVMPSIKEGLGLAILEAQLRKVPVVASNVGGIPEIVRHNFTGLLVEPKDEHALAKAILQIKGDNKLKDLITENARQTVIKDFSSKQMADNIEKVYQELVC